MNFLKATLAAGLVAATALSAQAADITGAGATFPFPIYSKWADAYKKETGNGLNYQSIGSGAGIKQIQAKTVTFGATDAPLKAEQLEKDGLVQWPQVMGAIVPVVNVEGVKPGELVFTGETARQHLSRQDHQVGRRRDQEAQSVAEAAVDQHRGCPPFGRLGHHVRVHRLPVEGERGVEVEGRLQHRGRMAGRRRRQGQRRRCRQRRSDQELDRLRRVCLCEAEQADPRRG